MISIRRYYHGPMNVGYKMTFSEDGAKLRTEAENIEEIKNAITHYFHGEPGKHLGENKECPLCRDMVNYEASESDTKQN